MSPDLSRRLGRALGTHVVLPAERAVVTDALTPSVQDWPDLPAAARELVERIEARPGPLSRESSG